MCGPALHLEPFRRGFALHFVAASNPLIVLWQANIRHAFHTSEQRPIWPQRFDSNNREATNAQVRCLLHINNCIQRLTRGAL